MANGDTIADGDTVSNGDTVSIRRLRDLLSESGRRDPAAVIADRTLAAVPDADIPVSLISKVELEGIYRRRLGRPGFDASSVPGSERLLDDLARYQGDRVATVSVAHAGSIAAVWLDSALRSLVAVTVGRDRRHR